MDLENIAREHVNKTENVAAIGLASLSQLLIDKGIITSEEFQNSYDALEDITYKETLENLKSVGGNDDY